LDSGRVKTYIGQVKLHMFPVDKFYNIFEGSVVSIIMQFHINYFDIKPTFKYIFYEINN